MSREKSPRGGLRSQLANTGRFAGDGISEDNYDDESCGYQPDWSNREGFLFGWQVKMPSDGKKPEELNGECIIVQEGRKK